MKAISPTKLQEVMAEQPEAILIDVRTPMEFAEVHIPPARNIPLGDLKPGALSLAKDQPVYLVCRTEQRAIKAVEKFTKEGFTHPILVEGGTLAWLGANLPATRGVVKVISLERQVRIAAGLLVLTGVLLGWFVHPAFYGLAGFVGAGLVFAGITDFCGMGLLLAKLPWNRKG